jgi:hypothetical protein
VVLLLKRDRLALTGGKLGKEELDGREIGRLVLSLSMVSGAARQHFRDHAKPALGRTTAMTSSAEIPSPQVGMRYVVRASSEPSSSRFPGDTSFRGAERR